MTNKQERRERRSHRRQEAPRFPWWWCLMLAASTVLIITGLGQAISRHQQNDAARRTAEELRDTYREAGETEEVRAGNPDGNGIRPEGTVRPEQPAEAEAAAGTAEPVRKETRGEAGDTAADGQKADAPGTVRPENPAETEAAAGME